MGLSASSWVTLSYKSPCYNLSPRATQTLLALTTFHTQRTANYASSYCEQKSTQVLKSNQMHQMCCSSVEVGLFQIGACMTIVQIMVQRIHHVLITHNSIVQSNWLGLLLESDTANTISWRTYKIIKPRVTLNMTNAHVNTLTFVIYY